MPEECPGENFLFCRDIERELEDLYGRFAGALLRYAASIVKDSDVAGDVVQETFLRYFMERRYGRTIASPEAWLYRVLRNQLLDLLRKSSRSRQIALAESQLPASAGRDPEAIVQVLELARDILSSLSDREWTCLSLRAEGFSYREIANEMSVRSGTVGATLARIHQKLTHRFISAGNRVFSRCGDAISYLLSEKISDSS